MKSINIKTLLTKTELKKIEKFLIAGTEEQAKKLRLYLNKDRRKAKLKKKGVVADYLYYWLLTSTSENLKKKNQKLKDEENAKRQNQQDTRESKASFTSNITE